MANWPNTRINAWDTLLKARAIENMSYCIGVNRVGKDANNLIYNGHTMALDGLGNELPKNRFMVNVLMFGATGIATFASLWALSGKYASTNVYDHQFGLVGLVGLPILALIGIVSFFRKETTG